MSFNSSHPDYWCWHSMVKRCTNPKSSDYKNYGGSGVSVCERWASSFKKFCEDMGPRPGSEYSIDRLDGDKGYFPENCRWATSIQQNRNRFKGRLTGVTYRKDRGKWKARISNGQKELNLGLFADKWDAICARKSAENLYWQGV